MKCKSLENEKLLQFADFLFESNEDLNLALIGGLPIQGIISIREVRKTSDIDIAIKTLEETQKLVERISQNQNFQKHYNPDLEKYSIHNWEAGIHVDIYPEKIGVYKFDEKFWQKLVCPEGRSFCYASPEDLISIKMFAYLTSSKGKNKHIIDIYSIILGKLELDIPYLANRFQYLGSVLGLEPKYFLDILLEYNEKAMDQFKPKEVRMLKEEIEYIVKKLEKFIKN